MTEVPNIVPLFVAVVAGAVLILTIKAFASWSRGRGQPVLTVRARIVAKRSDVTSRHEFQDNGPGHFHADTAYYVTFQVESGDRLEFKVDGREYGLLAEADEGRLTFRGNRYLGFGRDEVREMSVL